MNVTVFVRNVNEAVQLADGISTNDAEDRIRSMFGLRRGAIVDNNNVVMSGNEPLHPGINYNFVHGVMEGNFINFVDFSTILTTIHRLSPFPFRSLHPFRLPFFLHSNSTRRRTRRRYVCNYDEPICFILCSHLLIIPITHDSWLPIPLPYHDVPLPSQHSRNTILTFFSTFPFPSFQFSFYTPLFSKYSYALSFFTTTIFTCKGPCLSACGIV